MPRPEGDRLVLDGGGILRCRPDGRDLHVFATGLRNIYDVALDEELNVFVRDNENDGGDYKIRVCHSFFGADHGYPYLYDERPDEALPPLADLGLGSSAGGVCYLERQFPPEYRGNLFFCEWGRSRRPLSARSEPAAASRRSKEIEFAGGAGKRPLRLQADRRRRPARRLADGRPTGPTASGPKRGRGRIYRITLDGAKGPDSKKPDPGPTSRHGSAIWTRKVIISRWDAQAALRERRGPPPMPCRRWLQTGNASAAGPAARGLGAGQRRGERKAR